MLVLKWESHVFRKTEATIYWFRLDCGTVCKPSPLWIYGKPDFGESWTEQKKLSLWLRWRHIFGFAVCSFCFLHYPLFWLIAFITLESALFRLMLLSSFFCALVILPPSCWEVCPAVHISSLPNCWEACVSAPPQAYLPIKKNQLDHCFNWTRMSWKPQSKSLDCVYFLNCLKYCKNVSLQCSKHQFCW